MSVHNTTPPHTAPLRSRPWRAWIAWTVSFLAFPVAGLAGLAAAGAHVDRPLAALAGGAVTGLIIGAAQALASRAASGPTVNRRLPLLRWVSATTLGMGVGLLLGASAVGFGTTLGDLARQGALTGLILGAAQALALPAAAGRRRWWWAAATPPLWALGWTVTTLAGVDVERQYTVFGATGALTYSALSGLLLASSHPPTPPPRRICHDSHHTPRPCHLRRRSDGTTLADALIRRGHSGIRLVNRSGAITAGTGWTPPQGVEIVGGDATDPGFTTAVAAGARVVYQVLNPPYTQWVQQFPALQAGVLAAAQAPAPGWCRWRTSTCTAPPPAARSPRTASTTPPAARAAYVRR